MTDIVPFFATDGQRAKLTARRQRELQADLELVAYHVTELLAALDRVCKGAPPKSDLWRWALTRMVTVHGGPGSKWQPPGQGGPS